MIVRPARASDLEAIQKIMAECDLLAEGVAYDDFSGPILVAERQGQVIGFIQAHVGKPYAVVTEYGVLPEFQKGSAAYRLVEGMELILRQMGVRAWAAFVNQSRNGFHDMMERWGAKKTAGGTAYMRHL